MDEKTTDLGEVIRLMSVDHPDETPENGTQYINWKIEKKFETNKECILNGRTIQYNYFTYSVDQIPGGAVSYDDGTYTKSGFVIPYSSAGKVRYIISRNTYAQTFLRKMLGYTGRGEIVNNSLDFTGDMFVWLISKVYSSENTILSESDNLADLNIDSIKGFKGNTEDLLAKVSMSGESVMNIISALSFLIESQNLNQVTINLSYKDLKALMSDLKAVYAAVDEQAALDALETFAQNWDNKYPKIAKSWRENWANLSTYFKYPQEVRRLIYTVQEILVMRAATNGACMYPFYGFLKCPKCGMPMVKVNLKGARQECVWTCGGEGKKEMIGQRTKCETYLLPDRILKVAVFEAFNSVIFSALRQKTIIKKFFYLLRKIIHICILVQKQEISILLFIICA